MMNAETEAPMRSALLKILPWPAALLLACGSAGAADDEWRYVVPPPGDPFEHPPLRAIALSATKPPDLEETAHYRGKQRRYAQLRFGSPTSVRVTVVVDEIGPKEVDLYVDAGRRRRIEDRDRVSGTGLIWRLPVEAAFVEGTTLKLAPRTLLFRYGPASRTLAFAAAGYLEGPVRVGDRTHRGRRTDAGGNGLFTDARDRLWIDLDDNGVWDSATEQFLSAPILTVGGQRYAVRADARGQRLALERLEGEGKIRLALKPADARSRVLDVTAMLVGRDGSAVTVQGSDEVVVPVGEYRLHTITATLSDPAGGPRWTYQFSDSGAKAGPHWYAVARDATVTIDPIGKLDFRNGVKAGAAAAPGKDLDFQLELYTGDGLLVVFCVRGTQGGEDRESSFAETELLDGKDRCDAARTGFL
jgi:hypothetical protein